MKLLRFQIANLLDKLPSTCWVNLVFWALGYQTLGETFGKNSNWKGQTCRWDNEGTPFAYCNKCGMTGRYFLGHPMPVDKPLNKEIQQESR